MPPTAVGSAGTRVMSHRADRSGPFRLVPHRLREKAGLAGGKSKGERACLPATCRAPDLASSLAVQGQLGGAWLGLGFPIRDAALPRRITPFT